MTMFVPFTEVNDWEGETWTFWLQLEGNERELVSLKELISKYELHEEYNLDLNDIESEEAVDRMVSRAQCGYMSSDNKVSGRFVCPEDSSSTSLDEDLYKGGITDFFKE